MIEERAQERLIGDVNYRVQPIAFGVGLKALNRLIKVMAPILAAALREGRNVDRAAVVLEMLPQQLTDEDLDYFRGVFSAGAWYGDEQGEWIPLVKTKAIDAQELHFAGRYNEFVKWLVFCVEVNYGGFFDGVATEASAGEAKGAAGIFAILASTFAGKAAPSSSPTPGNGSSGES